MLNELRQWFHDSEEICEHDTYGEEVVMPCAIMADHLLAKFDVLAKGKLERIENLKGWYALQGEHSGFLFRDDVMKIIKE